MHFIRFIADSTVYLKKKGGMSSSSTNTRHLNVNTLTLKSLEALNIVIMIVKNRGVL